MSLSKIYLEKIEIERRIGKFGKFRKFGQIMLSIRGIYNNIFTDFFCNCSMMLVKEVAECTILA